MSFLKSRGFWACIGATVSVAAAFFVGDQPVGPALQSAVLAWVGYFGVTLSRKASGAPTSYEKK